ncbi:MAG: hypothetical protein DDT26_02084 [Dehalococcoidia bacterium]|nr:hypothetical protein [Chloroflexota bacterium]
MHRRGKVPFSTDNSLGNCEVATHGRRPQAEVIEPMNHRPAKRTGQLESRMLRKLTFKLKQLIDEPNNLDRGRSCSSKLGLRETRLFGKTAVVDRFRKLEQPVCVVQPAKLVEHVTDMVFVPQHPRRVLRRDDAFVGREVQGRERTVRPQQVPERAFRRRDGHHITRHMLHRRNGGGQPFIKVLRPPAHVRLRNRNNHSDTTGLHFSNSSTTLSQPIPRSS